MEGTCDTVADNEQKDGFVVLVVEDEYFIANEISEALQEVGANILGPVGKLDEALRLIEAHRIDAVVLDINLRGELAFSVGDELAARGIPFVFATGYDPLIIPQRHRNVSRWEKPYDASTLSRYVIRLKRVRVS